MRFCRYRSVSRCSVKSTSFCRGEGDGGGNLPGAVRNVRLPDLSRQPRRREELTEEARELEPFRVPSRPSHLQREGFEPLQVSISAFSSAMERAAVA